MRKTRIAFMPVSCVQHSQGKDGLDRPSVDTDMIQKAYEFLVDEGYDVVYDKSAGIIDTYEKGWQAIRKYKYEDVDCILFFFAGWFWVTHYMQAVRWANLPIIGWSPNIARAWNLNDVGVMNGAMKEWGLPYKGVWGLPGEEFVKERIKAFSDAAKVRHVLERSRFGLFGGTSMGIAAGFADFNEWGRKFGIFTEHTSELVILEEARQIPEDEVKKLYNQLKEEYGSVTELDEPTDRAIRHYLAYRKIIEKNGYDFTALKCTFDASDYYVSACLSQSLLAKEGFVSACEGDCYAALTARICQIITDAVIFTADVQHVKKEDNLLVLVADGAANPNLACSRKDVALKAQWTGEATCGGVCLKMDAKPGKVTIARVTREGPGNHACQIATGTVVDRPQGVTHNEYCDCGFPNWPHAYVRLDGDMVAFIDNMNVEYVHMVYGDIKDSLIETCNLLDIVPAIS